MSGCRLICLLWQLSAGALELNEIGKGGVVFLLCLHETQWGRKLIWLEREEILEIDVEE
jgi:hypothetical protein